MRTVPLPDSLDDARLDAVAVAAGTRVRDGDVLATFTVGDRQTTLTSNAEGVLACWLVKPGSVCRAGMGVAIVAAEGDDVGWHPSQVRSVRIRLLATCTECGGDFPVNGLVDRARCVRCGDDQRLPQSFWRELETDVQVAYRNPGERSCMATGIEAWGMPPLCRRCNQLLPMSRVTAAAQAADRGEPAAVACACGETYAVRTAPAAAQARFSTLRLLLGEVVASAGELRKPVVFNCPACSAPLQIDGERRIVRCRYCAADVYLPADLWLHLNPSAKRATWWMLFATT